MFVIVEVFPSVFSICSGCLLFAHLLDPSSAHIFTFFFGGSLLGRVFSFGLYRYRLCFDFLLRLMMVFFYIGFRMNLFCNCGFSCHGYEGLRA